MTSPPTSSAERLYPARPFLASSVAVFRDGRVLLAARGRPPGEGLYSLPGGQVETGETLREAALRELHEEVGVQAAIIAPVDTVEIIERDEAGRIKHHVVVVAHAARWIAGEARTGPEARDVRWIAEQDIAGLPLTQGLAAVLARAFAAARREAAP